MMALYGLAFMGVCIWLLALAAQSDAAEAAQGALWVLGHVLTQAGFSAAIGWRRPTRKLVGGGRAAAAFLVAAPTHFALMALAVAILDVAAPYSEHIDNLLWGLLFFGFLAWWGVLGISFTSASRLRYACIVLAIATGMALLDIGGSIVAFQFTPPSGAFVGLVQLLAIMAGVWMLLWVFPLWAQVLMLAEQAKRDRLREMWYCTACEYDLRGTIAAGRRQCPECGKAVELACPRCGRDCTDALAAGRHACDFCRQPITAELPPVSA